MSVIDKKVRRDVIPRWRPSGMTGANLEFAPAHLSDFVPLVGEQQSAEELLKEFEASKKPLVAAEALSAAILQGDGEVALNAARILSGFDLGSRPTLAALVEKTLSEPHREPASESTEIGNSFSEASARSSIRHSKRIVRSYPGSPLAWLDLAFSYVSVGEVEKARTAVITATSLNPDHRAIARAASRFYVHSGDFDKALSVLSSSRLIKTDPWMVSAHIATARAGGNSSKLIVAGRKMFKDDNFHTSQLSELGAALATGELEHGNSRLAEKIVKKSLLEPTENAVAQVAWLETIGNTDFSAADIASKMPTAWEARTFEAYESSEWIKSCKEASLWLKYQPFSSRPAVHGSYVAATFLQDFELALKFSEAGFRANPTDSVVSNNYVVSLAEVGNISKARKIFEDSSRESFSSRDPTIRATNGLLLYREGSIDAARISYEEARAIFNERNDFRSYLLASLYQAREEERLGNNIDAHSILIKAIEQADKDTDLNTVKLRKLALVSMPTSLGNEGGSGAGTAFIKADPVPRLR